MINKLIQCVYDQREPLPTDTEFYERALEDIEFFGVSSQLYCLLKERGQLGRTPTNFRERLEGNYTKALYHNLFMRSRTEQVLRAFEEAGIEAIPLKGVLFAERYFGHVGARVTTDIDVLVKPEQLDRAIHCVKSLGYTEEEYIPAHFHLGFSKPSPNALFPLMVELHWDLLKANTSGLRIQEFWQKARPLGDYRHIKELSGYHTFYMICLHGWRHNLSSLKYILDIIRLIDVLRDELDYRVLFRDAASHKTLKRITRTLAIVYRYFPHLKLINDPSLSKRSLLWWDYCAIRDSEIRSFKIYANFIYYQFLGYDTTKHCMNAIWEAVAPEKKRQKEIDSLNV